MRLLIALLAVLLFQTVAIQPAAACPLGKVVGKAKATVKAVGRKVRHPLGRKG